MSERCAIVTRTPSSSVSTLGRLVTSNTIASGGNTSLRKVKSPYFFSSVCSWALRMRSVPSEMRASSDGPSGAERHHLRAEGSRSLVPAVLPEDSQRFVRTTPQAVVPAVDVAIDQALDHGREQAVDRREVVLNEAGSHAGACGHNAVAHLGVTVLEEYPLDGVEQFLRVASAPSLRLAAVFPTSSAGANPA
jgi:hypothetical protein